MNINKRKIYTAQDIYEQYKKLRDPINGYLINSERQKEMYDKLVKFSEKRFVEYDDDRRQKVKIDNKFELIKLEDAQ